MTDGEPKVWGESILGIPLNADRSKLTEPQRKYLDNLDHMQKVGGAIGGLCFAWSGLEHQLEGGRYAARKHRSERQGTDRNGPGVFKQGV